MWYVIQTETGREQELVDAINRVLCGAGYKRCFVIRQECVWRIGGGYKTYIRPMFPSYVFAETDAPEAFFLSLKRVDRLSRLLGNDGVFGTVTEEEQALLCRMMEGEEGRALRLCPQESEKGPARAGDTYPNLVRRSPVRVSGEGEITEAGGFLKDYLDKIVKKRLRKRSVTIEIPFLGENRRIQVGIRVEGEDPD
ncbi:hypothetical protein D3Z50_20225 [Clostridiaceae bacterium]|jgi:transcriptional antiterminator NusG|nr:hypothetical protein [Clostridium sp.]NBI73329.1 hypothetical protein [Clostridiaceae bacterium]